jgi:hypothetical protein
MKFDREFGYHATPIANEAAIDAEGLKAPFCISIGYPDFAGMLLDMCGTDLVIYEVFLYGETLHPDDDGPPNFRIHRDFPPTDYYFRKFAYCTGEDQFTPIDRKVEA